MAKKAVSQSRTMWVKKGDIVGGKKVQKGYLAQYGKPEKRVSAKVRMVTEQGTRTYKQGRRVNKPMAVGGGNAPGGRGMTTTAGGTNSRPSYIGKPGTRTKNYQTGEGMKARPNRTRVPIGNFRTSPLRRDATTGSGGTTSTARPSTRGSIDLRRGQLKLQIARKRAALVAASKYRENKARQAQMERELQALERQLKTLQ